MYSAASVIWLWLPRRDASKYFLNKFAVRRQALHKRKQIFRNLAWIMYMSLSKLTFTKFVSAAIVLMYNKIEINYFYEIENELAITK